MCYDGDMAENLGCDGELLSEKHLKDELIPSWI